LLVHVICGYCTQFEHAAPFRPHAVVALPGTHTNTTAVDPTTGAQQPPLHGLSPAAPHPVVHTCAPLHAVPAGQSVAVLQPQMRLT
jgi:hypothetical protein